MSDFLLQHYFTIKALHIIAVISWMAGLLYLPRLYVYHCGAKPKTEMYETFMVMEYRLLKYIMNPAMIATFILGLVLMWINGLTTLGGWFHAKILFVFILVAVHGMLARYRKNFVSEKNTKSANYYRVLNEVPTVAMAIIVILAVVKPF